VGRTDAGVVVIDDTYNPTSRGLAAVERLTGGRWRTVLVTPGMVELGRCQAGGTDLARAFACRTS
jgi:UDP-N-acetylmuramyl pentapeptide synthase